MYSAFTFNAGDMMRSCGWCGAGGHNRRTCPKMSKEDKQNVVKPISGRACSYCRDYGHNRVSCNVKKDDQRQWIEKNKEYKKILHEDMVTHGFGVGAIVQLKSDYYDKKIYNLFITGFNWNDITFENCYAGHVKVIDMANGEHDCISFPDYFGMKDVDRMHYLKKKKHEVLAPASVKACSIDIPDNWLHDTYLPYRLR